MGAGFVRQKIRKQRDAVTAAPAASEKVMDSATDESTPPDTAARCWDIQWRMMLSARYHQKRERYLDGVDRAAKVVSALGGAAAFSQLRASPTAGLWFVGFVTVVSTLSLAYGPATKARRHAELARDFLKLEAELVGVGQCPADKVLDQFETKVRMLEASEPASLGALVTQCHNELSVAFRHPENVTPLPWYQRLLKNVFDFDQSLGQKPPASDSTAEQPIKAA